MDCKGGWTKIDTLPLCAAARLASYINRQSSLLIDSSSIATLRTQLSLSIFQFQRVSIVILVHAHVYYESHELSAPENCRSEQITINANNWINKFVAEEFVSPVGDRASLLYRL